MYISNAFSLSMLPRETCTVRCTPRTLEEARMLASTTMFRSAIGHQDTAAIVSNLLGVNIPANRVNVQLHPGDMMLIAQYSGPRLPEGTTQLPEGAQILFWTVEL